jgi:hypothetical protein
MRQNEDQPISEPNVVSLADRIDYISDNPAREKEERRHKRLHGDFKASIRIGDKEDIVSVTDISRRGVRFSSTIVYKLGTMVKVAAPYTIDGNNIFLTGRIIREHRRSTKLVPGEYALEILPGV